MDFGPLVPANSPVIRELQPTQNLDLGRPGGPRLYPDLPSQESAIGESIRILRQAEMDHTCLPGQHFFRRGDCQPENA